jgi:hypothetical protein
MNRIAHLESGLEQTTKNVDLACRTKLDGNTKHQVPQKLLPSGDSETDLCRAMPCLSVNRGAVRHQPAVRQLPEGSCNRAIRSNKVTPAARCQQQNDTVGTYQTTLLTLKF